MDSPTEVIVLDHERMQRAKTAMLTPATGSDRYRIGAAWHTVDQGTWVHETHVDEVTHFGRHSTAPGDVLIVKRIDETVIAHVQVLDILMANTSELAAPDLAELGYASRSEFDQDWGEVVAGRVWLLHIAHLTPRAHANQQVQ